MASGGASGERFTSVPQYWGLSSGDFDTLFGGGNEVVSTIIADVITKFQCRLA